jgi:aminomethyltransferase
MSSEAPLKTTPLTGIHRAMGARMVPFAGYEMPVQFKDGVLAEHKWTRAHAGVFDVSHMGPSFIRLAEFTGDPDTDHRAIAARIEPVISGDIAGLKPGQIRYTILLNEDGGMLDDLMVGRFPESDLSGGLYIVVNGATKDDDFTLIEKTVLPEAGFLRVDDRALIAVQGPEAVDVVSAIFPGAEAMSFMTLRRFDQDGVPAILGRSGYTGEDGYEILIAAEHAVALYERLLADERVKPIGLGARDSLRLEAGLPLYGHDADPSVSPIEAGLKFAVPKSRRERGDLRGHDRLVAEFGGRLSRVRVGLKVLEGAPAREGAEIADGAGKAIGVVTSGGFSPSLGQAIAMGFVPPDHAAIGTRLNVMVRGKAQAAEVAAMPFVPHRYVRKP